MRNATLYVETIGGGNESIARVRVDASGRPTDPEAVTTALHAYDVTMHARPWHAPGQRLAHWIVPDDLTVELVAA